jgi:hypothetical protein
MIEHRVVFAARNIGETCQISEYGSRPILAKDMQESALRWELIRLEIATNGCQRLSQFLEGFDRCPDCQTSRASGNSEPG